MYIMVTDFDGHWDHIPNDKTSYRMFMIPGKGTQPEKIIENTQTIFIKKNEQTKKVEKAWKGFVNNFNFRAGRIYFKVNIDKEIYPIPAYSNYENGWHIYESELEPPPGEVFSAIIGPMSIDPPFFDKLKTTNDWKEFEDLAFLLLKLLGIHDIYKYESKEQAGKADGFFIFENLAVLYDCTLTRDFKERKKQQIGNYVAKLNTGILEYPGREQNVSHHSKQVWIITRGSSQEIGTVNRVVVKEVSIDKIIQIYRNRLENNIDENILEKQLISI